jgi:uncharacterized protein (UPF0305 family)
MAEIKKSVLHISALSHKTEGTNIINQTPYCTFTTSAPINHAQTTFPGDFVKMTVY